jgi:hypothetical protein
VLLVEALGQGNSLERWLVIFTAALVLVGLLQFGVFFWQVKWMRRNVEIPDYERLPVTREEFMYIPAGV